MPQEKKILKHSQEHSEFILSKIPPPSHKKHQNQMSKSLYTCIVNGFYLLITIVFALSPQLGGLGPKYQDLFIPFHLGEGKTLPDFHLRDLTIRSEL